MATFTSWGALEKALQDEMRNALQETADAAEMDVMFNNQNYYAGGTPKEYVRTGNFGASAIQYPMQGGGNSLSVEVGRRDYSYLTGSKPDSKTVYAWAEVGAARLVGTPGTWADTEVDIEEDMNSIFSSHFS